MFSAAKASQTYTGGTDVTAGTVRLGADVASCLGTGIVTVGSEATLDLNGKDVSACTMILSGGTITSSANGTNSTLPLHLTRTEDSRITFQNLSAANDMLMNGSEWNLGGKTLTLKLDGKDPDFYIQQTGNGVTMSTTTTISNSTIMVNFEGRTDLKTIAKSESPYIVTWATKPADTTEFVLDAATQELGFKCKVTAAGLRLMKNKGLVIIVQ